MTATQTAPTLTSDATLKAIIAEACPLVAFRFVPEWNEYQLAPIKAGKADWQSLQTAHISKPFAGSRSIEAIEARQDVLAEARQMQALYSVEF